jgi:hypothetical protein
MFSFHSTIMFIAGIEHIRATNARMVIEADGLRSMHSRRAGSGDTITAVMIAGRMKRATSWTTVAIRTNSVVCPPRIIEDMVTTVIMSDTNVIRRK